MFLHEPGAEAIRALHEPLRANAAGLRALAVADRARMLAACVERLMDARGPLGQALRDALLQGSGLSQPVIEHGLRTTLGIFAQRELLALHASRNPQQRRDYAVVVLAGNVFSAAARPLLLPLLCGTSVLAKASSADDALPRYLQQALTEIDPRVGASCAVVTFAHDAVRDAALVDGAQLLSAYGSDATIASLQGHLTSDAQLIAHGHGLGAMFIAKDALRDEATTADLVARAALDVAAYDQRGCLSPQAIFVERGGRLGGNELARSLSDALQTLETRFPRGRLDERAAADVLQWRGVCAATGNIYLGATCAVSYQEDLSFSPSPGYRHIAVYDCADAQDLTQRLAPLRNHLKALGVAGADARHRLGALAPYVCEVGAMQTPPLDAALDGLHPLAGFG